jgi:hypothetical protein
VTIFFLPFWRGGERVCHLLSTSSLFYFCQRRLGQPQDGRRKMEYAAAYDGYPVPVASNRNQSSWRGRVWANRCDRLFQKPGLRNWADHEKKNVEFVNPAFNPLPSPKGCLIVSPRPSQVHQLSLLLPKSSPLCFLVGESLTRTRCKL